MVHRKWVIPLLTSPKKLFLGSAVSIVFGIASFFLMGLYGTALGALLVPFFICMALYFGAFCAGLAGALLLFGAVVQLGPLGALCVLMALAPPTAVVLLLLRKRAPVHLPVYYGTAAALVGMLAFWSLYAAATGSELSADLYKGVATTAELLWGSHALWPQLHTMLLEMEITLRLSLFPQMVWLSCLSALLGTVLPIYFAHRFMPALSLSPLSPLAFWRVPRNLTRVLLATFLVSSLAAFMGQSPVMQVLSDCTWKLFQLVYGTICLSMLSVWTQGRKMGKGNSTVLMALATAGILILYAFGPMPSLIVVMIGTYGEARRASQPRRIGDIHSPFGPPSPTKKQPPTQ